MTLSDLEVPPDPATALGAVPFLRFLPDSVRRLVEDSFTTVAYPSAR
jgi:hypothetical protein